MGLTTTQAVGELEVIALTDGGTEFEAGLFLNTDEAEVASLLADAGETTIKTNFNAFLVKGASGVTLVDAGPRDLFGPACGNLPAAMTEAGVSPSEVSRVLITHLHPDHAAGTITAEGEAVFANAEMVLTQREYAFWSDAANFAGMGQPLEDWQKLAAAVLAAYQGRLVLLSDDEGQAAAPGITSLPMFGHTPGHCGYLVADGTAQLALAADIVHAQHLQIANPEIGIGFDLAPEQAVAARKRMLDRLLADQLVFSGGHVLEPKFNRVERKGKGFSLVAE